MKKDVIIALDFANKKELDNFLETFKNTNCFVKVGMELYYQYGNEIIKKLKEYGFKIFLDLKLHDIPTTVSKTMEVLKKLDVDIINLHAACGSDTMKAVSEIFKDTNTLVIAVTHLTSTDQKMLSNELKVNGSTEDAVLNLAKLTIESGLDGVVCSGLEVEKIKSVVGQKCICVCPGIRYEKIDDQKRIVTPKAAKEIGCDFIVVGRLVTKSQDMLGTYERIKKEFLGE